MKEEDPHFFLLISHVFHACYLSLLINMWAQYSQSAALLCAALVGKIFIVL
jgi:hypothetical protein